jgi:hypothetical protein
MGTLTIPNTFVTGGTIAAAEHNANFAAVATSVNNVATGQIEDGAVTEAKLATGLSPANFQAIGAFRAQLSTDQAISSADTNEIVVFDSEDFDVSSYFNNTTGIFTPTTAGIFLVSASVGWDLSSGTNESRQAVLLKNSTDGTDGTTMAMSNVVVDGKTRDKSLPVVTALVSMNGSTDQLRVYAQSSQSADVVNGGDGNTYFQAHLVGTT